MDGQVCGLGHGYEGAEFVKGVDRAEFRDLGDGDGARLGHVDTAACAVGDCLG